MNARQSSVIDALGRVYGDDKIIVTPVEDSMTIVHAMACDDKNNVVLSVSVPDVRDPDRPDVGDRVAFMVKGQARYGLIVVYRDMNDTAGIVPDGERRIRWEHIANIELITDERV